MPVLGAIALSSSTLSCAGQQRLETSSAGDSAAPVQLAQPPETEVSDLPTQQPQLVKRAELELQVEAIDPALEAANTLVQQLGGDVINLQQQTPTGGRERATAFLEMRVPQAQLDTALQQLGELGTVQRRSLTADDVSDQLVDFQARLKNLRRAEATVLEIMERSGDIDEVLKVAQELRNLRASIEQIDAQLQQLRQQVSYSTIGLRLTGELIPTASSPQALQQTWQAATSSLGQVTLELMGFSIWVLVYSPYWLSVAGVAFGIHLLARRRRDGSGPSTPAS
jgi:hypothetical protein